MDCAALYEITHPGQSVQYYARGAAAGYYAEGCVGYMYIYYSEG